ncbi:uncharacterized protein SOCEGT47_028940 [Sorangium cellulosum]|uniref:Secreted protein n=1 Tax=Sorangium cellulosum TaxID=56 RepID=A0A4P2Q0Q6_SORCE|nr:hypothetical protein [Sorangium cellulosum]AUX22393.1 uncharacterized protein SOCEGT47_028940 [Sorangium cellulosum]
MRALTLCATVVITGACAADGAPDEERAMTSGQDSSALTAEESSTLDAADTEPELDEDAVIVAEAIEVALFRLGSEHTLRFVTIPEDLEIGVEERAPLGRATLTTQMPEASVADLYLTVAEPGSPVPRLIAELAADDPRLRGREVVDALAEPVDVREPLPASVRAALLEEQPPKFCERGAEGARAFASRFCGAEDLHNSFCDPGSFQTGGGFKSLTRSSEDRKKDSAATTAACFQRVEVKHYYKDLGRWKVAETF